MKKTVIFVGLMLVITIIPLNVYAGDENIPEIQDEENDIEGFLVEYPILFNILQRIDIIPIQSFEFMDIKSAWFYEIENHPNYLFASINIKNLDYTPLRTIYAIRWTYNEKQYASGCHIHSNGEFKWFFAGRMFGLLDNWAYKGGLIKDISECKIDRDNNLIVFKIPKNIIGDPKPTDVLTYTNAWTGLRFISEIFTIPFGGEMAFDSTSFGRNYVIQY